MRNRVEMNFEDWEPIYHEIISEFGFSQQNDELAAKILASAVSRFEFDYEELIAKKMRKIATICGDADSLPHHLKKFGIHGTLIAADDATSVLIREGFVPDFIVTDLDGDLPTLLQANIKGSILVVHAHGDNISKIRDWISLFSFPIIPTVQCKPFAPLRNYGGFTDGDRAVILARSFGAKHIYLLGFDFANPKKKIGKDINIKLQKLAWARRLIFDLNPPGFCLSIP
ncbi:MAG: 6-hydroxymethylpterin diphosphokinase MptE-like protein [Methanomassiliicoccales archaeon]